MATLVLVCRGKGQWRLLPTPADGGLGWFPNNSCPYQDKHGKHPPEALG